MTRIHISHVLCRPVDFSDIAQHAVDHSAAIAGWYEARRTLLHVVEMPSALAEEPTAGELDLVRIRDAAAANARRKLLELIPEPARSYCTVETAVVEGRAHREVLRQATERQVDLIVMGVHGRSALDLIVLGSTTHHIIRSSACPVLIVPAVVT